MLRKSPESWGLFPCRPATRRTSVNVGLESSHDTIRGMIEIERKFRLSPEQAQAIRQHLLEKYSEIKPVYQADRVFLQGIDSFKDFKRNMPVVRLRTVNGKTEFAYKRAVNEAGDSLEHELVVESAEIMQKILEEMDFRQVTYIEKERIEKKEDGLTIVLDKVTRLGDFLELEVLLDEADQGEAEQSILKKAAEFGLTADDSETKKYDELLSELSDHNFQ